MLFYSSSLSQSNSLQVKGEDGKPVPFASVFVRNKGKVFIADSTGSIPFRQESQIEKGDTIFTSAVGYHDLLSVYSGTTIILQKRIVVLPEAVIVNGEGKIEEWGTRKNPPLFGYGCRQVFRDFLHSTGRIIYPEGEYRKAEIISVSFYDETGKGLNVPVRIRVYFMDKDSFPTADYLTDNVIVETKGTGWLDINLENKGLIFPKEGLVFAIELFATGDEYYYTEKAKTKTGKTVETQLYGFSLAREKKHSALTMMKIPGYRNKWFIERWLNTECGDIVCRVKVKVWR